jgi:hypothetical protein
VALYTDPAVVVRPDNTIDIVAASAAGQLYHAWYNPAGVFQGWGAVPGASHVKVGLSSTSPSQLDIWAKGATDNRLYHGWYTAGGIWHAWETSINGGPGNCVFQTGPSVVVDDGGVISVGARTLDPFDDRFVVRSWAQPGSVPALLPPTVTQTRPLTPAGSFVVPPGAENTSAVSAECGVALTSVGSETLYSQPLTCVADRSGSSAVGAFDACPAAVAGAWPTSSPDGQITALGNQGILWTTQRGCFNGDSGDEPYYRGVQEFWASSSCAAAGTWSGPARLDPCDPAGSIAAEFGGQFCNTQSTYCGPKSGLDRPEVFKSEAWTYLATGVFGTPAFQKLVLFRAPASDPTAWKPISVPNGDASLLPMSGGAVSFARTSSGHVLMARCEFGGAGGSNVALYDYPEWMPFSLENLRHVGNIADSACSSTPLVQIAAAFEGGTILVRWSFTQDVGAARTLRRGVSRVTPGGLVTLADEALTTSTFVLPTMVTSTDGLTSLLYWYQLDGDPWTPGASWSVQGAIATGAGPWSSPLMLSSRAWSAGSVLDSAGSPRAPWNFLPGPADYMKGAYLPPGFTLAGRGFYAQWIEPELNGGPDELFQAVVAVP